MNNPPLLPEFAPVTPTPAQEFPPWGLRDIIVGIVLYAILFVVLIGSLAVLRITGLVKLDIPADLRPYVTSAGALLFEASLVLPVWAMVVRRRHASWQQVGFRRIHSLAGYVLPFVFLILAFVISGVWGTVIQLMHWETQAQLDNIFGGNTLSLAIAYAAVGIVAPIAEETFFRGFITGGLKRRFGVVGALVVGAAFFAILHPPITIFPIIFALGFLLGSLYQITGSLWPGILMHAMFNTLGFVVQFFIDKGNPPGF